MASLEGFEPTTRCLEGSRSVQLSYRDMQATLKFYDKTYGKTSRRPIAFRIYMTLYRESTGNIVLINRDGESFDFFSLVFWRHNT